MGKYALGLDIGIASIGVAGVAIDQQNILFAGVHLFDAAENPKNGASLAEPRRNKRGLRRVTHRRAQRKREIRKLLAAHDVREIESIDLSRSCALPIPVWQLREHALRRPLTDAEFARVLFHIAKRRGYQSNRKDKTATDKADENKKVLRVFKAA
jgi:CRISPR-associated endonuclease Csn1